MKYRNVIIVSGAILAGALLMASCARDGAVTIAKKGKSHYAIVLSDNASPSERHAAVELRDFIRMATGAEVPVVADTEERAGQPPRIVIGMGGTAEALLKDSGPIDIASLGDDGFALRTVASGGSAPDILIAGGRQRGSMYGVYTLLEKAGFRWYTPKITRYPANETLKVPQMNEDFKPAFMSRDTSIKEARDPDWAARNRLNGKHAYLDETRGGTVGVNSVHTLDRLVPPSLYDEHPEYFPLIGGKRVTGLVQRCMSNPEIVKIAADNLREWMDSEPDEHIFSVSANDVGMLCQCDECRRITEEEGATSGLFLRFVNDVAAEIEKTHPQNYVSTLAYAITETAPNITKPRHNVIIRLCPFYICCGHPFSTCSKKASVNFYKTLQDWGKISDNIFIWHYATNFDSYLLPFPNFREFTTDLKTYRENAVSGMFLQGAGKSGSHLGDLRAWVYAQYIWDTSRDPEALIEEWMHAVYGNAYEPMKTAFDFIHARVEDPDNHLGIHDRITTESWPPESVATLDSLYTAAEKLAAGDEDALYYVRRDHMSTRYLNLLFNSGRLVLEDGVYKPTGNTVSLSDYEEFRRDMKELDIEGLREEPFDCIYEDQLGEKLREHDTMSIENEDIVVTVAPDLGGRIVSIVLKETGEEIIGNTDPLNYFYPSYGGYEESTTMTWGRTGFDNRYEATVDGRSMTLVGEEGRSSRSKGIVFERTMTLPERGARIDFVSTIRNVGDGTRYMRLINKIETAADPANAKYALKLRDGSTVTETAENFYRNGENTPHGSWKVSDTAKGWTIEHRFAPGELEACRLSCNTGTGTISMEALGFEKNVPAGGTMTRKHSYVVTKQAL